VDVYFTPEFEKEKVGDGPERTVMLFRICKVRRCRFKPVFASTE
jgi:hypothetical protein